MGWVACSNFYFLSRQHAVNEKHKDGIAGYGMCGLIECTVTVEISFCKSYTSEFKVAKELGPGEMRAGLASYRHKLALILISRFGYGFEGGRDVPQDTLLSQRGAPNFNYPFLEKASSFRGDGRYDYIIVGGGTAGCPLAATLSQNFNVLLLERGGSPYGNVNISHMQNFHISLADVSPNSPNQAFISTDGVINARARVLGGGTSLNAGFYTRASTRYVERVGWDGALVNESYPWVEKQIVQWPDLVPWQEAFKGSLLGAGISPYNGYTYDHLYGTKVGGTIFDKEGYRHTAADLLASANPTNLKLFVHATVQNIAFDRRGRKPKATGVVFKDENGKLHEACLSKRTRSEVILTSGSIGSSHLLMLSGVGPSSELKKMNIDVVLENEFVGKAVSDNPMNAIFLPTKGPVEQSLIQIVGITTMGSFIEACSGFSQSTDSIQRSHGIVSAEIGQLSTIPPKQRTLEAAQAYARRKQDLPREVFMGGFILEKIAGPLSKGHISLITTNIDDNPSITFNYFSHPEDLRRCVQGIRTVEKIARSKYFAELTPDDEYTVERILNMSVEANVNFIPKHTNDTASLEQFCRDTVITIWHYHGGCHVGKVVDPDYRVIGVDALRVIDGSTFIDSPGTNPQATVMMLGRYMGVKLSRERLGRAAGMMKSGLDCVKLQLQPGAFRWAAGAAVQCHFGLRTMSPVYQQATELFATTVAKVATNSPNPHIVYRLFLELDKIVGKGDYDGTKPDPAGSLYDCFVTISAITSNH
ncbi:hypothetical protein ACLOJK_039985 [Asimina triloba]